jgi:hypothetical protein
LNGTILGQLFEGKLIATIKFGAAGEAVNDDTVPRLAVTCVQTDE